MKKWVEKAREFLDASLTPPKHELNELDWKAGLSPDKKRLSEHLSALSNYPGGGFLIFGIDAEGCPQRIHSRTIETIINQLSNLGREAVFPPVALDHAVEDYGDSARLLFVRIQESATKPVHIRGKPLDAAFIRSGGTTRIASRQEIGTLMLHSKTPCWEELRASTFLEEDALVDALSIEPILEMLARPKPSSKEETLDWLAGEKFIDREAAGGGYITNLGAIAAAPKLSTFEGVSRKAVRIIVYDGQNKAKTKLERDGTKGYAITFQNIISFVTSLLPQSEVIEQALRVKRTVYPEVALRELVANALIHQDFTLTGTGPMVEIFDDRIEISNPGGLLPSKQLDRLIGTQPESRNEHLASAFRRYKVCEERGSGLVKAGVEVELYGLPPIEFSSGANFFKVTLHAPRTFAQMTARERLNACYQHAVLKHLSGGRLTNTSLRERLKMPEKQRSMVSALILEAITQKRIKYADPENRSKKFTEYLPHWA